MTVVVFIISVSIGERVVSPLLGNSQLVPGGVRFAFASKLAICISIISSYFLSDGGRVSGGLLAETKTVLPSYLRKDREKDPHSFT